MSRDGDAAARQLEWLTVLAETSRAFGDTITDCEALLRLVAERTAIATNACCMVALISDDGEWLAPVARHDTDPAAGPLFAHVLHTRVRVGAQGAGTVAKTGEPAVLDGGRLHALASPAMQPALSQLGTSTVLIVPLIVRGIVIGTLALGRHGDRPAYTELDRRMIDDLAARAALAIDNARLYRDLEKRLAARTLEVTAANHELEALSYSISHDLRAPLRAIDGFAKILVEDHGDKLDAEARRVLGVICTNAEKMGVLIDALLSYARVGRASIAREPVDMTALARSAANEVSAREPDRIIEIAIQPLPPIACNEQLLRQVWVNLLANAVKFTRGRDRAMIEVHGARADNEVVYTVTDNGVGFDMKYASKLFGVFQRMHDAARFEGTGVGLALVQRIVTRHGGRVWADAQVDRGATFSFALPFSPAK